MPAILKHTAITTAISSILLTTLAVLTVGCSANSSERPPEPPPIPMKLSVVSGEMTIESGKWMSYTIEVKPDMVDPTLRGRFTASGGSGNDVVAAVGDEMNVTNWVNGHEATLVWETPGQMTTGSFAVKLRPGTYNFVISNKFSVITDKKVTADVTLFYGQRASVSQ